MQSPGKNVLVVDDEPKILEVVTALLTSKGFRVHSATDGHRALAIFNTENIALVVLDLMLPDLSGEEICLAIRKKSRVPIIMLTARAEESDLLRGLSIGADDYIVKPFSLRELYARIEAVLRRSENDLVPLSVYNTFRNGDLIVDFERNIVKKKGVVVPFTPSEIKLLSTLLAHPGRVFSRNELIDLALGSEFEGYDRAIDSHIKNIRQKIEDDPKASVYIVTVHGLGYRFGGDEGV